MIAVAHVVDSGGMFGKEQVLLALLRRQARGEDVAPTLVCFRGEGEGEPPLAVRARALGVRVAFHARRRGFGIRDAVRLGREMRALGAAVVHTHDYKSDISIALCPRRVLPAPRVATIHGYEKRRSRLALRICEALDRIALRRFDRVAAVSAAVEIDLARAGLRPPRVARILNGFDAEAFLAEARRGAPAALPHDAGPIVGAVGRLVPVKGYDVLIRAFAEVARRHPRALLAIVGDGEERGALEALVSRLGLSERVHLAGFQSPTGPWIERFDVFALPSRSEGLPVALLEACALGRPAVASAAGGIPEVIRDGQNGLLVPAEDPGRLAAGILSLLEDPARARTLGEAARATLEGRFSARAMAKAYLRLYEELLAGTTSP
ncbi:MAG: glycosyltransferase [Planctomycetes bacterium]|nr:glycosyltransferase [Planctomycetota bacterium]